MGTEDWHSDTGRENVDCLLGLSSWAEKRKEGRKEILVPSFTKWKPVLTHLHELLAHSFTGFFVLTNGPSSSTWRWHETKQTQRGRQRWRRQRGLGRPYPRRRLIGVAEWRECPDLALVLLSANYVCRLDSLLLWAWRLANTFLGLDSLPCPTLRIRFTCPSSSRQLA